MVRLSETLRKREMERVYFDEHREGPLYKLQSNAKSGSEENLYEELLGLLRQVLLDITNARQIDVAGLKYKISLLSDFISKDDSSLLRLIERRDTQEDYLVVHNVNVCILSLEVGRGLNYSREAMLDLGLGAILHDIGMIKVSTILQNKRRLYTAEYEEVKNHVAYGEEILNKLGQTNERILSIIRQHHERRDGSGYLKGLSGDKIDEYAQIVGLADVYEALIHSRPYRQRHVPFEYETVKEVISNREMFDPYILKIFLERLTRHPGYMLWLATSGIYELLEQQTNVTLHPETKPSNKNKYILSAIIILAVTLMGIFILRPQFNLPARDVFYPLGSSLGIASNRQPLKMVYNFTNTQDPSLVSLDLAGINLEGYHFLSFSSKLDDKTAKKMRYATLKITLENVRKEASGYYLQGVSNKWQEFRIPLSYFESIKDWSSVNSVSFVLQPWNIDGKEGALYIDDIHFYRKK